MMDSASTQVSKVSVYETKNKPSTLIERIMKRGQNPKKYMRIMVNFE